MCDMLFITTNLGQICSALSLFSCISYPWKIHCWFIYLHYNPILILYISLYGQVMSQNNGHFLISETLEATFLTPIK